MPAKIVLTLGKRKLEFTPEEARKAMEQLQEILTPKQEDKFAEIIRRIQELRDKEPVERVVPMPYPVYPPPVYPRPEPIYPHWKRPEYEYVCQVRDQNQIMASNS